MKLSEKCVDFIKLIERSEDIGDGWRKVSDMLRPTVEMMVNNNIRLFESRQIEGKLQVKLTVEGAVLADWI